MSSWLADGGRAVREQRDLLALGTVGIYPLRTPNPSLLA